MTPVYPVYKPACLYPLSAALSIGTQQEAKGANNQEPAEPTRRLVEDGGIDASSICP